MQPKVRPPESRAQVNLREALEDLAENVDLGAVSDDGRFIHWCYVAEDSRAAQVHGQRVGAACCSRPDLGLDKVLVLLLNWTSNRGWSGEVEGRWFFLMSTLRKILIAISAHVWIEVLRAVKAHWELDDSLEASLRREIDANENNFSAKSKLKLLKIVQALCCEGSSWRMAVMFTVLSFVHNVMRHILVDRVPLTMLIDLVADCLEGLVTLLEDWSPRTWRLLSLMHGEAIFEDDSVTMFARGYGLQVYAACYDHFEDRMEHPPYSLLCVPRTDVPQAHIDANIAEFYAEPWHCLSLGCRKLRAKFATADSLKASGKFPLNAIASSGQSGTEINSYVALLKGHVAGGRAAPLHPSLPRGPGQATSEPRISTKASLHFQIPWPRGGGRSPFGN